MLINIHDSHLEKVGFLDSESPGAPGFFNDVEHHYLAEGASTFTFSVNNKGLVHFSYERYLENQIRNNIDFDGTPIILQFKNKSE